MAKYIVTQGIRIAKDFVPETFGRLTTIGPKFRIGEQTYVVARCACGSGVAVHRQYNLTRGTRASCGCLRAICKQKHGQTSRGKPSPEWLAWKNCRARCTQKSHKTYKNYGGRGITVWPDWCPEGRADGVAFSLFLGEVGPRPSPRHTLDRINVDGNYEPGNVRWATPEEQQNNKRNNRHLTLGDITMTLAEWSRKTGIKSAVLFGRLDKGWSVEDALTRPLRVTARKKVAQA